MYELSDVLTALDVYHGLRGMVRKYGNGVTSLIIKVPVWGDEILIPYDLPDDKLYRYSHKLNALIIAKYVRRELRKRYV